MRLPCCAVEEQESVCWSMFFHKVCMPVYNLQKVPPHLPLQQITARLFSVFTIPCQVSSQFMVSHSCICSLCCFPALRNPLSILTPSACNLFQQCQEFFKHVLLCFSLHHLDMPAAGWLLRMLSLRATLMAFCWGKRSSKLLSFFVWFPWHQRIFFFAVLKHQAIPSREIWSSVRQEHGISGLEE